MNTTELLKDLNSFEDACRIEGLDPAKVDLAVSGARHFKEKRKDGRQQAAIRKMAPGPNRAKERSKTFKGIAQAMAEQWG